jgi:LPS sulfotransferase NodH
MTVTAEFPGPSVALSFFLATTPWSGSQVLCQALRATRQAGNPQDYFSPLDVVPRSQEWGLLGTGINCLPRLPEKDFAARYLRAVARHARTGNGVVSVNLPWTHQRWLVRLARAAAAAPGVTGNAGSSDAEVIESWYPQTRYLYLTRTDTARQAARWYEGRRHPAARVGAAPRTGEPPDFQEVRWIETLISRQEEAWEIYFGVHGIDPYRIEYEELLERPDGTLREIFEWLGLPSPADPKWIAPKHKRRAAAPIDWLPDYLAQREELSLTIGIREGAGLNA